MGPGVSTPAVLAVDGGNSKTDVALVDAGGGVLGAARGPGHPTTTWACRPPWTRSRR